MNMAEWDPYNFSDGGDDGDSDGIGCSGDLLAVGGGDTGPNDYTTVLARLAETSSTGAMFERKTAARGMLEAFRQVYFAEQDVGGVIAIIEKLVDDVEQSVRAEVMDQMPQIALFCHEESPRLDFVVPQHILPHIVRSLTDRFTQVRQASQSGLLILLERGIVASSQVAESVLPVIVDFTQEFAPEDLRAEMTEFMIKLAPLAGKEITVNSYLDLFCRLCDDSLFQVRRACATGMGDLANVIGTRLTEVVILPKFITLCKDTAGGVRKGCADVFTVVSTVSQLVTRKKTLAPAFVTLLQDSSIWVRRSAYQTLGSFITTFAADDSSTCTQESSEIEQTFLERFKALQTNDTSGSAAVKESPPTEANSEPNLNNGIVGDAEKTEACNTVLIDALTVPQDDRFTCSQDQGEENKLLQGNREQSITNDCNSADDEVSITTESAEVVEENSEPTFAAHDEQNDALVPHDPEGTTSSECVAETKIEDDVEKLQHSANLNPTLEPCESPLPPSVETSKPDELHEITENDTEKSEEIIQDSKIQVDSDGPESVEEIALEVADQAGEETRTDDEVPESPESTEAATADCVEETQEVAMSQDEQKDSEDPSIALTTHDSSAKYRLACYSRQDRGPAGSFTEVHRSYLNLYNATRDPNDDEETYTRPLRMMPMCDPYMDDDWDPENTFPYGEDLSAIWGGKGSRPRLLEDVPKSLTAQQDVVPVDLLEHYTSMCDPLKKPTIDDTLTGFCAYYLPAVVLTLGPQNWFILRECYESLACSMQWKIRYTLASSLHEIARVIGPELAERDLVPFFNALVKDVDEVRVGLLRNLASFIEILGTVERRKCLESLRSFLETDNKRNWRFRLELTRQLDQLTEIYDADEVYKYLRPIAVDLVKDGVAEVRKRALYVITNLILRVRRTLDCDKSNLVHDFVIELVETLCQSEKWVRRQTFAALSGQLLLFGALKPVQFAEDVLPHLVNLSYDPVPNVRLILAQTMVSFVSKLDFDKKSNHIVSSIIETLQFDTDRDVRYFISLYEAHHNQNET